MRFSKLVLRGKVIAIEAHIKKQENSQINNITLKLKKSDKQDLELVEERK